MTIEEGQTDVTTTRPTTLPPLHLQSSLGQVKTTATDNVNVTVKMTTNGQGKKRACERHSFYVQCLRGTALWRLWVGERAVFVVSKGAGKTEKQNQFIFSFKGCNLK